jgi:uncharacterized protein (TIGR02147 family)
MYKRSMELNTNILKTNFRLWLQNELAERCKRNSRYSLRSFAALIEVEPSAVSQIIAGKRNASTKLITRICNKLSVNPAQIDVFLKECMKKNDSVSNLNTSEEDFVLMAEDAFAYISNWYYAAILELTFTQDFNYDIQWMAKTLSLTQSEIKIAVERLLRLGLLEKQNGTLVKVHKALTNFTPGFTSSANKEFQRQILTKALAAIDEVEAEKKDITSMTMAIDVDKLPEAKKIITKFRRDMCAFLEEGEQTEVYNLGIQLYPITRNKK